MSFVKRRIDLKFQLGQGSFGDDGFDTIELKGLRVSAELSTTGDVSFSQCNLRVWGMPLDVMNKLTILGVPKTTGRRNVVTVSAGDDDTGVSVVFIGTITEAWINAQGSPEVSFVVAATAGYIYALKPVAPTSYKGTVDAATIVRGIAAQMRPEGATGEFAPLGLRVENTGVSVQLVNPYLSGSAMNQLRQVAKAGNFNLIIENGVICIWPAGKVRGQEIPLISPKTGLVGYPDHTQAGIRIVSLYNPNLKFGVKVKVESALTPTVGFWSPYVVSHQLESEMPGGKWFTTIECNVYGSEAGIGNG